MFAVTVEITRYADDSQPGWVECRLRDASGKDWVFVEKVPLVTDSYLDADSDYPKPGSIACHIVERRTLADGREVTCIDTEHPWDIAATTGEYRFEVEPGQVRELPPRKLPEISCNAHGKHRMAFLCCHLARGVRDRGFFTSPLPQDSIYAADEQWAWCRECEKVRAEKGWGHLTMNVVCALCFEEARSHAG